MTSVVLPTARFAPVTAAPEACWLGVTATPSPPTRWATVVAGPLGDALVAWGTDGICAVRPACDPESFQAWCRTELGCHVQFLGDVHPALRHRLEAALVGDAQAIDSLGVALEWSTPFQREVLSATCLIPRGEIRTYAWIASRVTGDAAAARAVGRALAGNPVPLVVPCHRVVRSDGDLGGYGYGGPAAKRALLGLEGAAIFPPGHDAAERGGFEPPRRVDPAYRISSAAPSAS